MLDSEKLCLLPYLRGMKNFSIRILASILFVGFGFNALAQNITLPNNYTYPNTQTFKVLSWNVEHFVDLHDDPYINNAREDKPNLAEYQQKLSLFLKAIRLANAEVVVLQEFESAKFLEKLAMDSLKELGYQFFADAPSRTWYMNVVVMSKLPLGVVYAYHPIYTPVEGLLTDKGVVETQNNINSRMWSIEVYASPEYKFNLTGLHLKAGRTPRDVAMRKGQINFLKSQFGRFLKEDKKTNILVVGDLNSLADSEEINLFKSEPNPLIDPLKPNQHTHTADNLQRRLDYILMNANMQREMVQGSVKPIFLLGVNEMRTISDHLPVIAEFYNKNK